MAARRSPRLSLERRLDRLENAVEQREQRALDWTRPEMQMDVERIEEILVILQETLGQEAFRAWLAEDGIDLRSV
jgi:hypothetical protein